MSPSSLRRPVAPEPREVVQHLWAGSLGCALRQLWARCQSPAVSWGCWFAWRARVGSDLCLCIAAPRVTLLLLLCSASLACHLQHSDGTEWPELLSCPRKGVPMFKCLCELSGTLTGAEGQIGWILFFFLSVCTRNVLICYVIKKSSKTTFLKFYLRCGFIDFKAKNQISVVYSDLHSRGW